MEQLLRYNDFNSFMRGIFGMKMQKISVDTGFSCPNRDGTISKGGCTFCSMSAFTPPYCSPSLSVAEQLEKGVDFFRHKYSDCGYVAYFQSNTNTYAPFDRLVQVYSQALENNTVKGIIISTRPDCMSNVLLDYLSQLSRQTFVLVEYGVESTNDNTLRHINRGHTFSQAVDAIERTANKGVMVGAHMILGLPGEGIDDILQQAQTISRLPLTTVKLHQLQVIRNTPLEWEFINSRDHFLQLEAVQYIQLLADYIERLNPAFVLDRFVTQSPKGMVLWPDWGLKSYQYVQMLNDELQRRGHRQGSLFTVQ